MDKLLQKDLLRYETILWEQNAFMVGLFLTVLLYEILILFLISSFLYFFLIYFSIGSTDLLFVSECMLHGYIKLAIFGYCIVWWF